MKIALLQPPKRAFCLAHLLWFLAMVLICSRLLANGSVESTSGEIQMDVDDDGQAELILNDTGLGLGINFSPSHRLHVQGNALVAQELSVGASSLGSSNLEVSGTFSQSHETLSTNASVGSHSMVFADSSAGNITLTLPSASSTGNGRLYHIDKTRSEHKVFVRSAGGGFDGENAIALNAGAMGALKVISYSGNWLVLELSGNVYVNWSPLDISTALWFDASDAASVIAGPSGNVGRWEDKSGNDYHVTQTTANQQPTTGSTTLNGLNVIDWPDSQNDDYLAKDGDGNQNWQDVYILGRYDGGSKFYRYYGLLSAFSNSGTGSGVGFAANKQSPKTKWWSDHKWWDNHYFNGSVLNAPYVVLGGTPTLENPFLISVSADSAIAVDGLCIGNDRCNVDVDRGWLGYLAEIIVFDDKLSDGDRQKVEGYLAHKWGLESDLPVGHPYKSAAP